MIIVSRPHLGGVYSGPEPVVDGMPGDDYSLTDADDITFYGGHISYAGVGNLDISILLDDGEIYSETNETLATIQGRLDDGTYHVGTLDAGDHYITLEVRRTGQTEWASEGSFLLSISPSE